MVAANFKFMIFVLFPALVVLQMATNTAEAQSLKEQYRNQSALAKQPPPPASEEVRKFLQELTTAERMVTREGRIFIIPRRTRKGYKGQVQWAYDSPSLEVVVLYEYGGYLFGRETRRANQNAIWKGNSLICPDKGFKSEVITLLTPLGAVQPDGTASFKSNYARPWYMPLSQRHREQSMNFSFEVNLKTQECYGRDKGNPRRGVFRCNLLTLGQARKGYKHSNTEQWADDYPSLTRLRSHSGSNYADCKVQPARDG